MGNLNDAATFEGGIEIGSEPNSTAIYSGTLDPSSNNEVAPQGSLYLRSNGELWRKFGAGSSDWVNTGLVLAHKDNHKLGGSDAFTSSDLLDAVVRRLRETDGPTDLLMGAVADDQLLHRVGAAIVGIDKSIGVLAPSVDVQEVAPVAGSATTSGVFVDMPGASFITTAGATRDYIVNFTGTAFVDKANKSISIRFVIGGVIDANSVRQIDAPSANAFITIATTHAGAIPPGTEVKIEWAVVGGASPTLTLGNSTLNALGIEV
jgi:hypothetical protein